MFDDYLFDIEKIVEVFITPNMLSQKCIIYGSKQEFDGKIHYYIHLKLHEKHI